VIGIATDGSTVARCNSIFVFLVFTVMFYYDEKEIREMCRGIKSCSLLATTNDVCHSQGYVGICWDMLE
jgi:hypothetical protein